MFIKKNTHSKSAREILKQHVKSVNSRDYISLLTCLILCSSVFLVHSEHVFVYLDAFISTVSFLISFILHLKTRLHLPSLLSALKDVFSPLLGWVKVNKTTKGHEKPLEVSYEKSFCLMKKNFHIKNLCWSLFLIKSATLLKRDSKAEIFLWIFRIF